MTQVDVDMMEEEDAFIMYASMRITGNMVLEKQWQ